MTPVFAIKHKPTGKWLHIRRFDGEGQVLLTEDVYESWCGPKEQAVAQASFLEPAEEYLAVELPAERREPR
jgi:hypothetical protein